MTLKYPHIGQMNLWPSCDDHLEQRDGPIDDWGYLWGIKRSKAIYRIIYAIILLDLWRTNHNRPRS